MKLQLKSILDLGQQVRYRVKLFPKDQLEIAIGYLRA